jgi:pyridoxamine 5'-phosphate oxidase
MAFGVVSGAGAAAVRVADHGLSAGCSADPATLVARHAPEAAVAIPRPRRICKAWRFVSGDGVAPLAPGARAGGAIALGMARVPRQVPGGTRLASAPPPPPSLALPAKAKRTPLAGPISRPRSGGTAASARSAVVIDPIRDSLRRVFSADALDREAKVDQGTRIHPAVPRDRPPGGAGRPGAGAIRRQWPRGAQEPRRPDRRRSGQAGGRRDPRAAAGGQRGPEMTDIRQTLRQLPVLKALPPDFEIDAAPHDPADLFLDWLRHAIRVGVPEPHAMVLSTVDRDGVPDARVLILKDLDVRGFHFAISAASRKGRQLEDRPAAALTFYWPALMRQIRVRGDAVALGSDEAEADFSARPAGSRAASLPGRQSDVLGDEGELDRALEAARARLADAPDLTVPHWRVFAVRPTEVEFWQGAPDRRHLRLRYRRDGEAFRRERLWP